MNDDVGIKISKKGDNVLLTPPKDLAYTSEAQAFKIMKTGELFIDLPTESIDIGYVRREVSFEHNLGYRPVYFPFANGVNYDQLSLGGDWIVNDQLPFLFPTEDSTLSVAHEAAFVSVTETEIILMVERFLGVPGPLDLPARRCTYKYTLFWESVDQEIDLLT